jgi:hypothetical protein
MTGPDRSRQFNCYKTLNAMPNQSVVLLGNLPAASVLDRLVVEFGWTLEKAASFEALRQPNIQRDAVAVLFEATMWGLGWHEALRMVVDAAPAVCPILCHRLSDTLNWPELSVAGAFHALAIPFRESEAKQSLGFVWAAKSRPRKVIPLRELGNFYRLAG